MSVRSVLTFGLAFVSLLQSKPAVGSSFCFVGSQTCLNALVWCLYSVLVGAPIEVSDRDPTSGPTLTVNSMKRTKGVAGTTVRVTFHDAESSRVRVRQTKR